MNYGSAMLKKLFRSGEKELVESLRKHVALSREATSYSLIMLTDPLKLTDSEIVDFRAKIVDLEKRGDKIYDTMTSYVLRGALPLSLVADLGVLLDDFDDILDLIYFLGIELTRGIKVGLTRNPIVRDVYRFCGGILEKAIESLSLLDAVLTYVLKDIAKAGADCSRIDYIEDVVDELKNAALEEIYMKSDKLNVLEFTHLVEIVKTIDTIVDRVQDASQGLIKIFSAVLF
ncbi:MAG: DUF47 family protein [Sulfolobales archaeon]|nr:DUF47 family protein [Sulfolobales archaeon]